MKRRLFTVMSLLFGLIILSMVAFGQEAKEPEGKGIFIANKCNSCHSLESAGLKKKPNQKPPDLSNVGAERNAEWIIKYLQKKETIDGVKHMGSFKGKDEDREKLAKWLETLKTEEAKPKE